MRIEILFKDAAKPKVFDDGKDIYTKGGFVCITYGFDDIVRYPIDHIFSIHSKHQPHGGSTSKESKAKLEASKIKEAEK
jgi:hypothetical protein